MTPPPSDHRDLASAYVDGNPDAVRAARPPAPSEVEWDAVRLRIHSRVALRRPRSVTRWVAVAAVGVVGTAIAAAVAWLALAPPPVPPQVPDVVQQKPVPPAAHPDPLAEFDVLPMASAEEVVLHRVPGDGWLPVGAHPLADFALATADEVTLDDPDPAWPTVIKPSPTHAPMIFAAKPR